MNNANKNPAAAALRGGQFQPKRVASTKGKGSYRRQLKHKKQKEEYDEGT